MAWGFRLGWARRATVVAGRYTRDTVKGLRGILLMEKPADRRAWLAYACWYTVLPLSWVGSPFNFSDPGRVVGAILTTAVFMFCAWKWADSYRHEGLRRGPTIDADANATG